MDASRRNTLIICLCVLGVGGLVAKNWVMQSHQRHMLKAQQDLTEEREMLRLHNEIAATWPVLQQHESRLQPDVSQSWLMGELTRLAARARVQLTTIEPERVIARDDVTWLKVRLRFECPYHTLGNFVSFIESSDTYLHVDELDVAPGPDYWNPETQPLTEADIWVTVRMSVSTMQLPEIAHR